jgi:regulator of nucleoside diphosphate kinase
MSNNNIEQLDNAPMILTTGLYDLLKDQIRRKKLSREAKDALEAELKRASQVLRKDLPDNIVTTDTVVSVKELDSGGQFDCKLVAPGKARRKNRTLSILSPIGIAMLGYAEGTVVQCDYPEGMRKYQILKVSRMN